jgi:hypothetical protein
MKYPALLGLMFLALSPAAIADDLSADVQAYVDRRKACNYWPSEHASGKVRRGEIQRHIRELNCPTLDREEAVLNARYSGKPDMLAAIADAHDAMPD